MSHGKFLGLLVISVLLSSCHTDTACDKDCDFGKDLVLIESALKEVKFIGDEFGIKAYQDINTRLKSGHSVQMAIYKMQAPGIESLVQNSQEKYHLYSLSTDESSNLVIAHNDTFECVWNTNSLYEICDDTERFEASSGVDKSQIFDDEFYLGKAYDVLNTKIQLDMPDNYQLYPYKKKYGINGSASSDAPDVITETIYDVGLSFASTLDGWPVIGPGGKIYVHLDPQGELLATKVYRKIPSERVVTLTEADIKSADEALAELSRDRDYDLDKYIITRAEFGYFYWGKNSIQNLISPYYVFFLASADSIYTTEVVEIVSAVKGEHAEMIQNDYQLEVNRKSEQIKDVPDEGMTEKPTKDN